MTSRSEVAGRTASSGSQLAEPWKKAPRKPGVVAAWSITHRRATDFASLTIMRSSRGTDRDLDVDLAGDAGAAAAVRRLGEPGLEGRQIGFVQADLEGDALAVGDRAEGVASRPQRVLQTSGLA